MDCDSTGSDKSIPECIGPPPPPPDPNSKLKHTLSKTPLKPISKTKNQKQSTITQYLITNIHDYRLIDSRYGSRIRPGTGLAQATSERGILASKASMTRGAEYGELRLAGENNHQIQILEGKGGAGKFKFKN